MQVDEIPRPRFPLWVQQGREMHGGRFKYLGTRTENQRTKLVFSCPVHGVQAAPVHEHLRGHGCPVCGNIEKGKVNSLTFEEWVEKARHSHGTNYIYERLERVGRFTYLHYECPEHGHVRQQAYTHCKGSGCPSCGNARRASSKTLTVAEWEVKARKTHGAKFEYLTTEQVDGTAVLTIRCPEHGIFRQSAGSHVNGNGCNRCGAARRILSMRSNLQEFSEAAGEMHKGAYEYLELINKEEARTSVRYVCKAHGERVQDATSHKLGQGCSACTPSGVMGNKHTVEIAEYLQALGLEVEKEFTVDSSRRRWDVTVPAAKLAIEFDGVYYHSDKFKSGRSTMSDKAKAAESAGYRQINIWEDEWYDRKEQVKRLLASAAGVAQGEKVFARNTEVVQLAYAEAEKFLEANHIQGAAAGDHYRGLKHGDAIVACIVYSYKGRGRSTRKVGDSVDVQRYATSCRVPGGFQKLLAHILEDEKVRTVFSYSDPRQFTGGMYAAAGFKASPEGAPDYCYTKSGKRIPKRARQKSWFKGREGVLYDPELPEAQLAKLNGYHRLWTRGKVLWTLTR